MPMGMKEPTAVPPVVHHHRTGKPECRLTPFPVPGHNHKCHLATLFGLYALWRWYLERLPVPAGPLFSFIFSPVSHRGQPP